MPGANQQPDTTHSGQSLQQRATNMNNGWSTIAAGRAGEASAGVLFHQALQILSVAEIASALAVRSGTVARWMGRRQIPEFYQNDLLRVLGRQCHTGVAESDQFYTAPGVAEHCMAVFHGVTDNYGIDLSGYHYLEPGAGCGYFYRLLPKDRRLGLDIEPKLGPDGSNYLHEIKQADYLRWQPDPGQFVVVGNPPFGRNGKTALDFVLKSFAFADYVAFVLPPIFHSTGKGSCYNRLTRDGYALLHTENLADGSFVQPDGTPVGVKTVFQVWAKQAPTGYIKPQMPSCADFVDIRNVYVSYKPSRPSSNVDLVGKCDLYIPRSFWPSQPVLASRDFSEVPYGDGYGLIVKKRKRDILRYLKSIDWREVAHVSTNGSMSIRKDIITQQLALGGFSDHAEVVDCQQGKCQSA